ncbi:hypothetical protein V6R21_13425 [Limibacter armeniacum]|uniref:ATP-binding protein n=1 Tax=Limibacter armeniacum TaxID=466084 RepID=UPI002FE5060D
MRIKAKNYLLSAAFIFLLSFYLHAQSNAPYQALFEKGLKLKKDKKYETAYDLFVSNLHLLDQKDSLYIDFILQAGSTSEKLKQFETAKAHYYDILAKEQTHQVTAYDKATVYRFLGRVYHTDTPVVYDSAYHYFDLALSAYKKLNDYNQMSVCIYSKGYIHRDRKEIIPTIECYEAYLQLAQNHTLSPDYSNYFTIQLIKLYLNSYNYKKATDLCKTFLESHDLNKLSTSEYFRVNDLLATSFAKQNQVEEALLLIDANSKYADKHIKAPQQRTLISGYYHFLKGKFLLMNMNGSGVASMKEAKTLFAQCKETKYLFALYFRQAVYYNAIEDYPKALQLYQVAKEYYTEPQNIDYSPSIKLLEASLERAGALQGKSTEEITVKLKEVIRLGYLYQDLETTISALTFLNKIFEEEGIYNEALTYSKQLMALKDSIQTQKEYYQKANIGENHLSKMIVSELEQIKLKHLQLQWLVISSSLVALLIILVAFLLLKKSKRDLRQSQKTQHMTYERLHFFQNCLSNIRTQLADQQTSSPDEILRSFKEVEDSILQTQLVHKEVSMIRNEGPHLYNVQCSLSKVANSLNQIFDNRLNLEMNIASVYHSTDEVEAIICFAIEALVNTLKHNPNQVVSVTISLMPIKQHFACLEVTDNGKGFSNKSDIPYVLSLIATHLKGKLSVGSTANGATVSLIYRLTNKQKPILSSIEKLIHA